MIVMVFGVVAYDGRFRCIFLFNRGCTVFCFLPNFVVQ